MYSGKFSETSHNRQGGRYTQHRRRNVKGSKRAILLTASLLILVTAMIGGTMAYLSAETAPVNNTFSYGQVPIEISETFQNNVKSDVAVTNKGNVDAFVRIALLANWKDSETGNVVFPGPKMGEDYIVKFNQQDWHRIADFYYCKTPVKPGETSPVLVRSVYKIETAPEGYDLSIEVLAQSVQADGMKDGKPMVEAIGWPVKLVNGQLAE